MRKVLFLMFLLLLMGLGAAGVKAQVRIGGNGSPNAAAVLDLNATDATTGTKGLALPRVSLGSNTAILAGTTTNIDGMLVYNTNTSTTGGMSGVGLYYWYSDSSRWVQVMNRDFSIPISKIRTTPTDSAQTLISDGKNWVLAPAVHFYNEDTILSADWPPNTYIFHNSPFAYGICIWYDGSSSYGGIGQTTGYRSVFINTAPVTMKAGWAIGLRCLSSNVVN